MTITKSKKKKSNFNLCDFFPSQLLMSVCHFRLEILVVVWFDLKINISFRFTFKHRYGKKDETYFFTFIDLHFHSLKILLKIYFNMSPNGSCNLHLNVNNFLVSKLKSTLKHKFSFTAKCELIKLK